MAYLNLNGNTNNLILHSYKAGGLVSARFKNEAEIS